MNVNYEIKCIISELLVDQVEPEKIKDDAHLETDLGFDSIGFVSLIVDIEEKFGIQFQESMFAECELEKVNVLVSQVEKMIGDANA